MTNAVLPSDSEGMNDSLSEWAGQAIDVFMLATGTELADVVSDLLADLIHWCDRHEIAFEEELARARFHYEAETLGDDHFNQEEPQP